MPFDNENSSGSAYVFDFDGTSWNKTMKLVPADGAPGDEFGYSVSVFGNRALVGARRYDEIDIDTGAVYVFELNGTSWAETAKLRPTRGGSGGVFLGWFGHSVSLSGNRALVGARGYPGNFPASGAAYIFDFDGTSWSETATLAAALGGAVDGFGYSVSLSGDRALIGAPFNDNNNGLDSGSAHVFDFDGKNWSETQKLTAADGAAFDEFGISVSLVDNRALIGARFDDHNGINSGSAYVFDFDDDSWMESVKLTPADGTGLDQFGISVSLSGDRALVGARFDDDNGINSGSAYAFDFDGKNWSETLKLTAADGSAFDEFGISVSLVANRALVGAWLDDDNGKDSGSAYVVFAQDNLIFFDGFQQTTRDIHEPKATSTLPAAGKE
jgi:hypothetical protein